MIMVLVLLGGGIAGAQLLPTLRPVGAAAEEESEGEECESGLAINVTVGMVCSDYCEQDADCAISGWRCRRITQGNGSKVGFCAPLRQLAHPEEPNDPQEEQP
jgi:hypothetical protein